MSHLTAKQGMILLYWCARAGVEEAKKFMVSPDAPSGHFSRKFKKAIGHTNQRKDLYIKDCPGYDNVALARIVAPVPLLPAHEQVAANIEEDVGMRTNLADKLRTRSLPLAYYTHPVVVAHPDEAVVPLAIFIDGLGYSLVDSVIAFWVLNLISGTRFLVATLRKKTVCRCGCRGWCSLHVIFLNLLWSIRALAAKTFPSSRDDNKPWLASDERRRDRAGTAMRMRCAVLYHKADWAEHSASYGYPTWQDNLRP